MKTRNMSEFELIGVIVKRALKVIRLRMRSVSASISRKFSAGGCISSQPSISKGTEENRQSSGNSQAVKNKAAE